MVTRAVRIFWDGLRLGGDAERISFLASMLAMKVSLLRASRKLVSSTFTFIMIPLHVALLSILLFVTEVLVIFGAKMVEVQNQGLSDGIANDAGVSTTLLFTSPDIGFRAFVHHRSHSGPYSRELHRTLCGGGRSPIQALSLRIGDVFSIRPRDAADPCGSAGPFCQRRGADVAGRPQ